jgi:hypothetical protein
MLSEKLRPWLSRRWILLALTVGLAVTLALSMALAGDTEAQTNRNNDGRVKSIFVYCNPNGFNQCTNTLNQAQATQTFTGSGTPRTNNVRFKSKQTGKVFSRCTFLGTGGGADQYFCKTKKKKKHRH